MKRRAEDDKKAERKVRRTEDRPSRTLNVTPIQSLHSEVLPSFRQPIEVGCFSLDVDRKFYDDNHQLKYFCLPHTIKFNLRDGYQDFLARDEDVKERLDHLLMWVDKHRTKFELAGKDDSIENGHSATSTRSTSLNTDFIAWRGHFTKILCTPYETREPWKFAATLYKRTIYLSEVETPEAYDRRKNMEDKYKEMCYWGHKFETFVCKLVSEKQKRTSSEVSSTCEGAAASSVVSEKDSPVNNSEAFISVVRTRLEKHSLVFGAEVDCCTSENEPSPGNYIELKTSSHPHNHNQHRSFKRYKLLKWWAQSYLAGIPKIIAGFRHHHYGQVDEIQTYNTLEIPRLADLWEMNICLNFLNKFLDWAKTVVVKDDPKKVYMLSFSAPFRNVVFEECSDGENSFLPEWYTKEN